MSTVRLIIAGMYSSRPGPPRAPPRRSNTTPTHQIHVCAGQRPNSPDRVPIICGSPVRGIHRAGDGRYGHRQRWQSGEHQRVASDADAPSRQSGEKPPAPCTPADPGRDECGAAQQKDEFRELGGHDAPAVEQGERLRRQSEADGDRTTVSGRRSARPWSECDGDLPGWMWAVGPPSIEAVTPTHRAG